MIRSPQRGISPENACSESPLANPIRARPFHYLDSSPPRLLCRSRFVGDLQHLIQIPLHNRQNRQTFSVEELLYDPQHIEQPSCDEGSQHASNPSSRARSLLHPAPPIERRHRSPSAPPQKFHPPRSPTRSSLHANTLGPHHESLPLAIPSKQQMMYASANPVTTLHVTTHHDFA